MRALLWTVAVSVLAFCSFLVTDSAVARNSPAQDQALDRWRACDHFASVRLGRIETSGRVFVTAAEYEAGAFTQCMREMATRQGAVLPAEPVVVGQIEAPAP
jgi:hypothetical protein